MYADNSLLPREVVRLAALGVLAGGPRSYGALAGEVRHFISRIAGPSLDLMGTSIELLRYEGLLAADGEGDAAPVTITDAGRETLRQLLRAGMRAPFNDVGKVVLALKIRFLHLLEADDRHDQADMMIDASRSELVRLEDLRASHAEDDGHFVDWLDHDIGLARTRLDWLVDFRARL